MIADDADDTNLIVTSKEVHDVTRKFLELVN